MGASVLQEGVETLVTADRAPEKGLILGMRRSIILPKKLLSMGTEPHLKKSNDFISNK